MRFRPSRPALLAAVLACWGCLSVTPPPPLFTAADAKPGVRTGHDHPERSPRAVAPIVLPDEVWRPLTREWNYIILHHSATRVGGAERFDTAHRRDRGWENGLGYHFVIGNGSDTADGHVEAGPRWRRQIAGAHAGVTRFNEHGIGICLVGDFRNAAPSARQIAALRRLVATLRERCKIDRRNVMGHGTIRPGTLCPGSHFPPSLAFEP